MQNSVVVRNAKLEAEVAVIGASPVLELRSGPAPVNCAAEPAGALLAQGILPAQWMGPCIDGTCSMAGTWKITAIAKGQIGHFRLLGGMPRMCHKQGTVTLSGGGGDMTANKDTVEPQQTVEVFTFLLRAGNR
jgi:hypothetical protein